MSNSIKKPVKVQDGLIFEADGNFLVLASDSQYDLEIATALNEHEALDSVAIHAQTLVYALNHNIKPVETLASLNDALAALAALRKD